MKILPTLQGKERIDCMIEIAIHYSLQNWYRGNDSAFYYWSMIHVEASKLDYKHAIAFSLLGLNHDSDSLRINNVKMAIQIAEELKDNEVLGWAYDDLQFLLHRSSHTAEQTELMKKSLYYFQKAGDTLGEALLCHRLSFYASGVEGFEYCKKSIQLFQQLRSSADWDEYGKFFYVRSLDRMCGYFEDAGDYSTALSYMRQAHQAALKLKEPYGLEDGMSRFFNKLGQYDSSLYYLTERGKTADDPYQCTILGETYLLKKDYEKAFKLFQEALNRTKDNPTYYSHHGALLGISKCFESKKDYTSALLNAKKGLDILQAIHTTYDTRYRMDVYELLARIYHHIGRNDSAYLYLQQHMILRDSANNSQNSLKLNLKLYEFKKEAEEKLKTSQINLLNKDNQLKAQKLKQQATVKNGLLVGLLLLFSLGVFVLRTLTLKRKNERLRMQKNLEVHQLESQKKQAELEMQALRAQINPHFIFNCLSSINRIIMKNDNHAASDYLTRFSRLMRMVLINSQRKLISLEDELHMLRLYLDMERLRFKDSFEYKIIFTNTIDEGAVQVPPLLLQPFCENAIWHGLMQKDGPGLLTVELSMQDNTLNCIITDNGIGREKAQERNSKSAEKEKSMGLKITSERLALLNREKELHTYYEIEDLKDEMGNAAGTRVNLEINYKETAESKFDQNMLTAENLPTGQAGKSI